MSGYNPRIYNYSNLEEKDKELIKFAVYTALDSMELAKCDYAIDLESENMGGRELTAIHKIEAEERIAGINYAESYLLDNIIKEMVARIDNYDYEVPEIDTDDYFPDFEWPSYVKFLDGPFKNDNLEGAEIFMKNDLD